MAIRYLYLNDNPAKLNPLVEAVTTGSDELSIVAQEAGSFNALLQDLSDMLEQYDGLLLDSQLNYKPNNGKSPSFHGKTLAREIRARGLIHEIKELPIVLWTTYGRLNGFYYYAKALRDLFDYRYDKQQVLSRGAAVRNELLSLAKGYQRIIRSRDFDAQAGGLRKMLALTLEEYNELNSRITRGFYYEEWVPAYQYARLIREAILYPKPLFDEEMLAARFGIDKDKSPDWGALLALLPPDAKYKGVFHEAWPRWWSELAEDKWWYKLYGRIKVIGAFGASKRVELLKQYTGLTQLVAAKPIKENYGDYFYTICEYYKRPLDMEDAIQIGQDTGVWHKRKHISIDVALERLGYDQGLRPHPIEEDYLMDIREERAEALDELLEEALS